MAEPPSPRLNHVAMSVPRTLVQDAAWRLRVSEFFAEVFGWAEVSAAAGRSATTLIFLVHSPQQFVFLQASDQPMTCPGMDHFGLQVSTIEELRELHRKAVAFHARDARVEIIPPKSEIQGPFRLTSFYVGFLLPMMIEVQHFEVVAGAGVAQA
jgi:hypothetical protein